MSLLTFTSRAARHTDGARCLAPSCAASVPGVRGRTAGNTSIPAFRTSLLAVCVKGLFAFLQVN